MSDKDKKEKVVVVPKQPKDIEMPPFPFQKPESGTRSVISGRYVGELDPEERRKLKDALQNFTIAP